MNCWFPSWRSAPRRACAGSEQGLHGVCDPVEVSAARQTSCGACKASYIASTLEAQVWPGICQRPHVASWTAVCPPPPDLWQQASRGLSSFTSQHGVRQTSLPRCSVTLGRCSGCKCPGDSAPGTQLSLRLPQGKRPRRRQPYPTQHTAPVHPAPVHTPVSVKSLDVSLISSHPISSARLAGIDVIYLSISLSGSLTICQEMPWQHLESALCGWKGVTLLSLYLSRLALVWCLQYYVYLLSHLI